MSDIYSTYDAKARFSEILRRVREGRTVTISYRGEPVAEIRPIAAERGLSGRLERLERAGVLRRASSRLAARTRRPSPALVKRRPGALERFLGERE
ncbi:MAG: type II toxin-antitoxin system prevent-host-death family antitoxin [Gemmatimonadota bacterium]